MINFLEVHWNDWKRDLTPIDKRMVILDKFNVKGMSSHNIRYFINEFCKKYIKSPDEVYLEVGSYQGCSLLSSALFNKHVSIGIDNFSQFNDNNMNKVILLKNVARLQSMIDGEIILHDMDFRTYFQNHASSVNIKIYFYDGAHDYQSQLEGLELALPFLTEKCIIFVDDVNIGNVRKANDDFLTKHPDFQRSLQILTRGNCSPDWWNGWEVLTRGYDFCPVLEDLSHRR